jgi:glycosyltransferase involved in cell wall biosynthesis
LRFSVCYVAPDVHVPHYRGASTHVLELSLALARLGDDVHVVCRRSPHEKRVERVSGVTLHRLYRGFVGPLTRKEALPFDGNHDSRITSLGYSTYLKSIFTLYAGLESSYISKMNDVDFIIERETAFGAGAIASKIVKKPLILELIGPRYSKISMTTSDIVLAYNERMVPESARDKTIYVKAAVNTNLFRPDSEARKEVRIELGIEDSTVVVGYVGTFQSWHGIDDLLVAAKHFEKRNDIRFMFVGPINRMQRDTAANVTIVGPVPYDKVYKYINAFDVAVAPYNLLKSSDERRSKGMGSPLKILEYMACGKPCIASSIKQVTDLLQDGVTGEIFQQGDIISLIGKIEELVDDEDERQRLGMNAHKVAQSYTWDTLAKEIHKLMEYNIITKTVD